MKTARLRPLVSMLPDGKVQIIGGSDQDTMEMFNPEGDYFTAQAHLFGNYDSFPAILRTHSRAALIHQTMPGSGEPQGKPGGTLYELLNRRGHSLTDISQSNQALLAGGVDASGQFQATAVLFAGSSAVVTTEKTEYFPGETVLITGASWQPGESVELIIRGDNGTPDRLLNAVADETGNLRTSEFAFPASGVDVTYVLTAMAQSSGYAAQTTFANTTQTSTFDKADENTAVRVASLPETIFLLASNTTPTPTVNIRIFHGQFGSEVPEAKEDFPGAFTVANLNDTDGDGSPDASDPDHNGKKTPKGRDEIDLMKCIINKPSPDEGGEVKLETTGQIKLWKESFRLTEETRRSFNTSELPAQFWVEVLAVSGSVADLVLQVTYKEATDKVNATGVAVVLQGITNDPSVLALPGTLDEKKLRDLITKDLIATNGTILGMGPFLQGKRGNVQVDTAIGGRILFAWQIKPSGVDKHGVVFDITRQIFSRSKRIPDGTQQLLKLTDTNPFSSKGDEAFPDDRQPPQDNELPNDDKITADEDNVPNQDMIYSFDSPGLSIDASDAFAIRRLTFREWVRVQLEGKKFKNLGEFVQGSRVSEKVPWHLLPYLRRGATGRWEFDGMNPSASTPVLMGDGNANGTIDVTVNPNAVTEGFAAAYDPGRRMWTLVGTSGANTTATVPSAIAGAQWTLMLPNKVTVMITQGSQMFHAGAKYAFSVFRSAVGKQNEVASGVIGPTAGP